MRKVYLDQTNAAECMSVFVNDAEVILVGTTVSTMSVKHKNAEYQRFADEYDIQFIFDDKVPVLDFYTIPQVDIFAMDSEGGYLASFGQTVSFSDKVPICYIDKNRKCFLIAHSGKEFLEEIGHWKEHLVPCEKVEFFPSKEEAEKNYEILDPQKMVQTFSAISRIQEMEQYLEEVLQAKENNPESFKSDGNIQKKVMKLTQYYENGLWLQDYGMDENGKLPADLKRGVLAQDTLYELLQEWKKS